LLITYPTQIPGTFCSRFLRDSWADICHHL
jgi:hypothetical protein